MLMQYITYSLLRWISTWCSIWHCYIFQLDSKTIWSISLESNIKISFLGYFRECHCNCIFHVLCRHHWVKSLCVTCVPEPVLWPITCNLHSIQITFSCNTVPAIEITTKFYKSLIACAKLWNDSFVKKNETKKPMKYPSYFGHEWSLLSESCAPVH